jgi:N-acetyl-anhydromuramyl-L-alanine amidase AmpD
MITAGTRGEQVKVWQKYLAAKGFKGANGKALMLDGVMGPQTLYATKLYQQTHSLGVTGQVTEELYQAATKFVEELTPVTVREPTPVPPVFVGVALPAIQVVQAKHFRVGRTCPPTMIVIHTMECAESATTAEGCSRYFQNPMRKNAQGVSVPVAASCHDCFDVDSIVQCVSVSDTAYHTPGMLGGKYINDFSIGYEHAGFAGQTVAQWADDYSVKTLALSAKKAAHDSLRFRIEPVRLTVADLQAGKLNGFTGHVDCTKASKSGSHWDPGPNFPWDLYIENVKKEIQIASRVVVDTAFANKIS